MSNQSCVHVALVTHPPPCGDQVVSIKRLVTSGNGSGAGQPTEELIGNAVIPGLEGGAREPAEACDYLG